MQDILYDGEILNCCLLPVETSRTKLEATDETPQPQRRLIKADISLGFSSSCEVIFSHFI